MLMGEVSTIKTMEYEEEEEEEEGFVNMTEGGCEHEDDEGWWSPDDS
jgi:hypothetical protein